MPAVPDFVEHCRELLAPLGSVRSRAMFGGHGFYVDGLFMALIAFERLYLKVDASTRARFEAAGCEPFVYNGKAKSVTMSYWTVPADAMESPALMQPWARLALQAALAARAGKPAQTRHTGKPAQTRHAGKPAPTRSAGKPARGGRPRRPR